MQKINSVKKLAENQSYANRFIKNNKPVPADLSADIKNNQAEVAKQEQLINERKAEMERPANVLMMTNYASSPLKVIWMKPTVTWSDFY